jgi:hypothetical protein
LWSRLALRQATFGDYSGALQSVDQALDLQPWHLQSWQVMYVTARRAGDEERIATAVEGLCTLEQALPECS